ncbi:MAG: patatin-like phospholipase family protein [Polyangiales bacterium]
MQTVLYLGSSAAWLATHDTGRSAADGAVHLAVSTAEGATATLSLVVEADVGRALRWITARPVDLVVVDAREGRGLDAASALDALERIAPARSSHGLHSRARVLALVDESATGARVAHGCGVRRLPAPLVVPTPEEVRRVIAELTVSRPTGKVAVCLAGGGIEGLLYEVGVLRAIDHFLLDRRLCDLDLFFGISAGSFIAALLANGVAPDDIADGLRSGNDRVPRIGRGDLFDPNLREMASRALRLSRDIVGRGEARNPLSALYRAIPTAFFAGDALRSYFERVFARPGMSDDFDDLRRPLFIGATDQDTSEAVTFGEPGWTDVPIHRAIRASCALMPFYTAEPIAGRYYVDGAFSRTTNMRTAVQHGATMCLLIDPLVPIRAESPGYVSRRGGFFAVTQGLKALINGRFDKAHATIMEMFPGVAFHLFRPEGDEMRVLSGSPMKFLYREEIEHLAYESTLRKLRAAMPRLQRDFARHSVRFGEAARVPGTDPYLDGVFAVS